MNNKANSFLIYILQPYSINMRSRYIDIAMALVASNSGGEAHKIPGMAALRAFRVFRALKAISAIPGLLINLF